MPNPENDQSILNQILLELRALQAEVSERLLFIEQRTASIDHKAKFFYDAWADNANQIKNFERRMIDIEDKANEVRNK